MTHYVNFSLPKDAIEPADKALIESALPEGYHLGLRSGNSFAIHSNAFNICQGVAEVIDGEVVFTIEDDAGGMRLLEKLKSRYPEYDDDRVLWAVFYQWHGYFSMLSQPTMDRELALSRVNHFPMGRNPVLCSFRAKDFLGMMVKTLTTQKIIDGQVSDIDEGPMMIEMTNLELARKEHSPDEFESGGFELDLL